MNIPIQVEQLAQLRDRYVAEIAGIEEILNNIDAAHEGVPGFGK